MATHEVLSPLPATFYRKPSPEAGAFVKDGDTVKVGDVIGLVEVMKMFKEVRVDSAGPAGSNPLQHCRRRLSDRLDPSPRGTGADRAAPRRSVGQRLRDDRHRD